MSNSNSSVLAAFKAEAMLSDSYVIERVNAIKTEMKYDSDGNVVSYEDMYGRLTDEVDSLPRLTLELDIPQGTEQQYSVQLSMAMEKIFDDCDRVLRRIIKFKSRLQDAVGRIKRLHGEFGAWYAIAVNHVMDGLSIKVSAAQIKLLGDSEFSRLLEGLDTTVASMLTSVAVLQAEIQEHKKTQQDKYVMGRDQVNASWTSHIPQINGGTAITRDQPGRLLNKAKIETENWDDVPTLISRMGGESKEQYLLDSPVFDQPVVTPKLKPFEEVEEVEEFTEEEEPHREYTIDPDKGLIVKALPLNCGTVVESFDLPDVPDIKGTFQKTGDAKPLTAIIADDFDMAPIVELPKPKPTLSDIEDFEDFMSVPEPTATVAPKTPRKVLTFDEEDF